MIGIRVDRYRYFDQAAGETVQVYCGPRYREARADEDAVEAIAEATFESELDALAERLGVEK
ncbi:MAG: hypothetical protein R8G01_01330 [Ilumatobacteraceae bacterium]|nr:hypothetical protein [Ilumatobacteraceae bacterium]